MLRAALISLLLVHMCYCFVPPIHRPRLRPAALAPEHCACNPEAARVTFTYVAGTMAYLTLATVNDWVKSYMEKLKRK